MVHVALVCASLLAGLVGDGTPSPRDLQTYEALKLKAGKDPRGAGQAGALVRGARARLRAAQAPGAGGAGRPRERDGPRPAGAHPLRRTLGIAREGRRAGQGRRGARGPARRLQRAAGQAVGGRAKARAGRRTPAGRRTSTRPPSPPSSRGIASWRRRTPTSACGASKTACARGHGAFHDGRASRPVARVLLAAPGVREAQRPMDERRAGGRRGEGRPRAAPGQSPLGAAAAEMAGLAGRRLGRPSRARPRNNWRM